MKNPEAIRERYMQDSIPVRLAGLAANLRRIKSFGARETNQAVVESLIDECKHFIEWTAPETVLDTAADLADLQIQLARWQFNWAKIWLNHSLRQQVAEQSFAWSERLMVLSGLLPAA
jgi:hypothetical protein